MSAAAEPAEHDATTRERVLRLVVQQGPVSAAELAHALELTAAAVRRHIAVLEDHGQIVVHEPGGSARRRRGRPARHYVATETGRAGLSDAYSDLASHALDYLVKVAGPEAIDHFAEARVHELERRYAPIVDAAPQDRAERARALAAALTVDGYAASVRSVGPEGLAVQLCQGNCPVQDVAEEFPQLCEAETRAFSRLLDVHVQRLATLAGGEHVCTTHIPISPVPPHAPARRVAAGAPDRTARAAVVPARDDMEGN